MEAWLTSLGRFRAGEAKTALFPVPRCSLLSSKCVQVLVWGHRRILLTALAGWVGVRAEAVAQRQAIEGAIALGKIASLRWAMLQWWVPAIFNVHAEHFAGSVFHGIALVKAGTRPSLDRVFLQKTQIGCFLAETPNLHKHATAAWCHWVA